MNPARRCLPPWWILVLIAAATLPAADPDWSVSDIDEPPHNYRKRPLADRFTRMQADLASGRIPLDRSEEKAFLSSLLRALEVPATSQMLVFSTTSLQLSLISPSNPRALYFNEEVYVGFIPGGRIEIVALDPELGGIFYIFDIPRGDRPLTFERSDRCMNCHAREDTGSVPGLLVKSVIPGPGGGSLAAYRIGRSGHDIPLGDRFGGWHVTGAGDFTNHWGNLTGVMAGGKITPIPNPPAARFRYERYPVAGSDLLAQLVHEHQVGFVNRVLRVTYLARQLEKPPAPGSSAGGFQALDQEIDEFVRYLLFAQEAPMPASGVAGNEGFRRDFLAGRRQDSEGRSLKDLDLRTRLFQHRCSYMIYSNVIAGLPTEAKSRFFRRLSVALNPGGPGTEFAYLPAGEKQAIRSILRTTLPDLPPGW